MVVASDGSKDATAEIVRSFEGAASQGRVRLLNFEKNRGKTIALNDAIPQLGGEIVAFSDASRILRAIPCEFWFDISAIHESERPVESIAC